MFQRYGVSAEASGFGVRRADPVELALAHAPKSSGECIERVDRPLVLAGRADVEPVGVAAEGGDLLAGLEQARDELRELARALARKVRKRALVVGVDAHADLVVEARLLVVGDDALAFGVDHAEVDLAHAERASRP